MNVRIREWDESDVHEIGEILREVGWWADLSEAPSGELSSMIRERLAACLQSDDHTGYVALDGEDRVGYVSVHWLPFLFLSGPEGHISELFVRGTHRGRGIGERLLHEVVQAGHERDAARLSLVNGTDRESYRRGFYTERGWRERDRIANFVYEY